MIQHRIIATEGLRGAQRIFTDANVHQILSDTRTLVDSSSETKVMADIQRTAELLRNMFQPFLDIELKETELGPVVIGRPKKGSPSILLIGHYDTVVPVSKAGAYREDGDRIYGAGISDMKASLAMALAIARKYTEFGKPIPFTLFIVPDEEIGSPESAPILDRIAPEHQVALILEPVSAIGEYVLSRRGLFHYRVEATGKDCHSGLSFDRADALLAVSKLLANIARWHDPAKYFSTNTILDPQSLAGKGNRVEGRATLIGEVRTGSEPDLANFVHWLEERVRDSQVEGVTLKLIVPDKGQSYPVVITDATRAYERVLITAMEHVGLHPACVPAHQRGASDLNRLRGVIPGLDGLGAVGFGAHTETECIDRASIALRTELLWELICRLVA